MHFVKLFSVIPEKVTLAMYASRFYLILSYKIRNLMG